MTAPVRPLTTVSSTADGSSSTDDTSQGGQTPPAPFESTKNQASGADDSQGETPSPSPVEPTVVQIHLASRGESEPQGVLEWLAVKYGLAVYERSRLATKPVRIAMGHAALLLTIIFAFELFAWWLLFNSIVHVGSVTELDAGSFLALGFASIFSLATWLYERQFLTADTSRGLRGLTPAVAVRVTIIVGAALMTSQPVELFIFETPIKARIHEESVIEEAVSLARELDEAEDQLQSSQQRDPEKETQPKQKEVDTAEQDHKRTLAKFNDAAASNDVESKKFEREQDSQRRALTAYGSAEQQLRKAERKVQESEQRVQLNRERRPLNTQALRESEFELERDQADYRAASRKLLLAKRALDAVNQRVAEARERADLAHKNFLTLKREDAAATRTFEEKKKDLNGEMKKIVDDAEQAKREAKNQKKRLRGHIRKVQMARPGEVVEDEGYEPYQDRQYDFFERLRVLADLRSGRLPRWPETDVETRKRLIREYGLPDPAPVTCGQRSADNKELEPCEPVEASERRAMAATQFNWSYWVAFGLAIVIPLVVIGWKLVAMDELKPYYSLETQARAGHPEALAVLRANAPRHGSGPQRPEPEDGR